MLRTITTTLLGIAAAAVISAPIANADNTPDMTSGNKVAPTTVASSSGYATWLGGTGGNPFIILTGADCKPVMGTWTKDGFVYDPAGKDVAWVNRNDGTLASSPYDDGLNQSSRDMLKRVHDKNAAAAPE